MDRKRMFGFSAAAEAPLAATRLKPKLRIVVIFFFMIFLSIMPITFVKQGFDPGVEVIEDDKEYIGTIRRGLGLGHQVGSSKGANTQTRG